MSTDNHGAAASGVKSEAKMKEVLSEAGVPLFKVKTDFEEAEISEWGTRYHKPPKEWPQTTSTGKQRKFVIDGFVPKTGNMKKNIIIEQKNSEKHGTTEEKVFYDLCKIMRGVYDPKNNDLWYVFTGPAIHEVAVYKEFEIEAKREGLPVKVIWGMDALMSELEKVIGGQDDK